MVNGLHISKCRPFRHCSTWFLGHVPPPMVDARSAVKVQPVQPPNADDVQGVETIEEVETIELSYISPGGTTRPLQDAWAEPTVARAEPTVARAGGRAQHRRFPFLAAMSTLQCCALVYEAIDAGGPNAEGGNAAAAFRARRVGNMRGDGWSFLVSQSAILFSASSLLPLVATITVQLFCGTPLERHWGPARAVAIYLGGGMAANAVAELAIGSANAGAVWLESGASAFAAAVVGGLAGLVMLSSGEGGGSTVAWRNARVAVVLLFVIAELMLLVLYLKGVDRFGHFVHYCAVLHLTGCALGRWRRRTPPIIRVRLLA